MTRRRWLVAGALTLVLLLVWVVPAAAGVAVDCGEYAPGPPCERAVSEAIEQARAQFGFPHTLLPVTKVELHGSSQCLSYRVTFVTGWVAIAESLC